MQKRKPLIVQSRTRFSIQFLFVFIVFLAIRFDVSAQEKEPVYLLFDKESTLQTMRPYFIRNTILDVIFFDYKSEKAGSYFHFVYEPSVDTTFYVCKKIIESKKFYDEKWFIQAYSNEALFMCRKNILIYLIDIRDERDGKFRVYQVSYEPLATL